MPVPLDWSKRSAEFVNKWKASGGRSDEYLGDGPFDEFVLTERAASWNAFLGWVSELAGPWSFRGQREAAWFLHTSLDRVVLRSNCPANNSGYYHLSRDVVERDLLFRFQQQAHLYIRHTPAADDLGSWFALMQHHGAPTRLLDWTLTPYVALYFALEEKPETGSSCAVWAIDLDWLERKGRELVALQTSAEGDYTTRSEQLNRLLGHKEEDRSVPTPLIVRIDPRQTDERMAAQQGVFLCSLVRKGDIQSDSDDHDDSPRDSRSSGHQKA